jgi:hypothetical protein
MSTLIDAVIRPRSVSGAPTATTVPSPEYTQA